MERDISLQALAPKGADPEEIKKLEAALTDWWIEHANQEIEAVAPKAVEYGSNSMIEVGRTMARIQGRHVVSDEEATEMACMFYIAGKIGRWVDAVTAGKRPSDDTIYDIGVYAKMAQRTRAVGGWPFAPEVEE